MLLSLDYIKVLIEKGCDIIIKDNAGDLQDYMLLVN